MSCERKTYTSLICILKKRFASKNSGDFLGTPEGPKKHIVFGSQGSPVPLHDGIYRGPRMFHPVLCPLWCPTVSMIGVFLEWKGTPVNSTNLGNLINR